MDEARTAEPPRERIRFRPPKNLHEGMTRADLIAALEAVHFRNGVGLVSIDEGVRDYIIECLQRR